jgi:hypothetical protein
VYGWLCGSWDLDVLWYRVNVAERRLKGEDRVSRVLEGRAVQDVWIMPRSGQRSSDPDRTMNMYGITLRSWDAASQSWRIAWTNPVDGHHEEQVGRWNGRDILQEGTCPDGTKTRWTFTDITANSFHWRGEALYPDTMKPNHAHLYVSRHCQVHAGLPSYDRAGGVFDQQWLMRPVTCLWWRSRAK